jgi:hypothetical protein
VELPVAAVPPLDRSRIGWWGVAAVNLVFLTTSPHLLVMALRDGGPPAVLGLDASDQGASQSPSGR